MNPCPHHLPTKTYGECKLGCNQCGQGFATIGGFEGVLNKAVAAGWQTASSDAYSRHQHSTQALYGRSETVPRDPRQYEGNNRRV